MVLDNDFPNFVLKNLYAYIHEIEEFRKRRSELRIYCRVDVSLYQDERGYHFFVNELTHGPTTAWFRSHQGTEDHIHAYKEISVALLHELQHKEAK